MSNYLKRKYIVCLIVYLYFENYVITKIYLYIGKSNSVQILKQLIMCNWKVIRIHIVTCTIFLWIKGPYILNTTSTKKILEPM